MRTSLGGLFIGATLALMTCGQAQADTTFTANLTHDQEVEPIRSTPTLTSTGDPRPLSFGTATFVLNEAQTELTMSATVFNIDVTGTQTPDTNDNLTAAHIHAPAPLNMTAGVRWGFFGTPDNDDNPNNLVITPFSSGVGGTFTSIWNQPEGNGGTTLTEQIPNLLAGLAYINFHTTQFGGGEIRGQLLPKCEGLNLSGEVIDCNGNNEWFIRYTVRNCTGASQRVVVTGNTNTWAKAISSATKKNPNVKVSSGKFEVKTPNPNFRLRQIIWSVTVADGAEETLTLKIEGSPQPQNTQLTSEWTAKVGQTFKDTVPPVPIDCPAQPS